MTMMEIAEKVENVFHVALCAKDEYKAFHLDTAMLVGITTDGNKVVDINAEVASNEDIYDLLADSDNARKVQGYDSVGLVTCGWAAPLPVNYDGESELDAPSKHPEKRRVRLMVCASLSGEMASVLRFYDDQDNPISDNGGATGDLANALLNFIQRANASKN
jgi:hypothetical protein